MSLALHQHGKSRVRLGRTWRNGNVHTFVEFEVFTMLESDMAHAFATESNEDMVATDTQKNCVYYVAKRFDTPCSPEQFAIAMAKHLVTEFPRVHAAKVRVEAKPWKRVVVDGRPHEHGYSRDGTEVRTGYAVYRKGSGITLLEAGLKDLTVLKTTQSGYAGHGQNKYTTLGDTHDRIAATQVTSTWRYTRAPANFNAAYEAVRGAFLDNFFGPSRGGVYSPSLQFTIYHMAKAAIARVPEVDSVFINTPNLHFIPINPVASESFADDVYVATSEPHGSIECVVTRDQTTEPHAKF